MSNALTTFDPTQLPQTYSGNADDFKDIGKTDYLLRLQLASKGRAIDIGGVKPGSYCIPMGDKFQDIGDSIDLLFLARRYKAVDMTDHDALIVVFDKNSDEYKRIEAESKVKDSNCMAGVDFLVYESSTGKFLDYHAASGGAAYAAPEMMAYLPISQADIDAQGLKDVKPQGPRPCNLKSKYIKKKARSFFVPTVHDCSNFANPPKFEDVRDQITKFVTEKGTEVVAPDEKRRSR